MERQKYPLNQAVPGESSYYMMFSLQLPETVEETFENI
jgi:hypothetical protein